MKCDDCENASKERFGCVKLDLAFSNGYMARNISASCENMQESELTRLRLYYGTLSSTSSPYSDYKRSVIDNL